MRWCRVELLTLTNAHADRTEKEQVATTELFDHVETRKRGCDVNAVGNDLNDERRVETGAQKVLSSVVDFCIISIGFSSSAGRYSQMKFTPVNCCND